MFFGDSLTWGYDPVSTRRYSLEERYTGILRERLTDCRIIEEGLKGRTNALDDPIELGRNGRRALPMLLCSHDPIDILVIMLGTNDSKRKFCNSAAEIAKGLEMNIQIAQTPWLWGGIEAPEILIVCPPAVTENYRRDVMEGYFDEISVKTSRALDQEYRKVARAWGCHYLNAGDYTETCKEDGVHLDREGHRKLAEALEGELWKILSIY